MRHLAWLHAKPEGSKKTRIEQFKATGDDHPSLKMPDIESEYAAGYVVSMLHEAGLMSSNGMGPVPLSWAEIESWLRVTQADIGLWEKLQVKRLSEAYVHELLLAGAKDRPAPYLPVVEEVDREGVEKKILSFLTNFRKTSPTESEQD